MCLEPPNGAFTVPSFWFYWRSVSRTAKRGIDVSNPLAGVLFGTHVESNQSWREKFLFLYVAKFFSEKQEPEFLPTLRDKNFSLWDWLLLTSVLKSWNILCVRLVIFLVLFRNWMQIFLLKGKSGPDSLTLRQNSPVEIEKLPIS